MKGSNKNTFIWFNIGLLLFIIFFLYLRSTYREYFEDAPNSLTAKKSETPIENVGMGPFDYGLNDQFKISSGAANSASYMGQQGNLAQQGDFHHNMFDYLK